MQVCCCVAVSFFFAIKIMQHFIILDFACLCNIRISRFSNQHEVR
jgi:hypothetical protein